MEYIDIFDERYKVSYYRTIEDTTSNVVIPLSMFLNECASPQSMHKDIVLRTRALSGNDYKEQKRKCIPCCTVGAVCTPTRTNDNATPNGLLCIDIDGEKNPQITDMDYFKIQVSVLPFVAYCARSIGGNGVYIILGITHPDKFSDVYKQLEIDFAKCGVTLDPSCKNISRARFMSYDEHPYINRHALPYKGLYVQPKKIPHLNVGAASDTERKVAQYVERIKDARIDLTMSYDDYMHIGMAISDLGEAGRQYFHAVCQFWEKNGKKYNPFDVDKDFDNFLRTTRNIHIGTFFQMCHDAGIYLSKPHDALQAPQQSKVEQLPTDYEKSQYKPNVRELQEKLQLQEVAPTDADAKPKSIIVPIVEFINGKAVPTNGTYELDADRLPDNYSEGDKLLAYWDFKYHPDDPLQIKGLGKNPPQKAI